MARVSLNKIAPIKSLGDKTVNLGEGETITVIQYLPSAEKADLIERVLNNVIDETGFLNPMRLDIIFNIELVKTYTNISITEKMMENPSKVYDLLIMNDILATVLENIPEEEYEDLYHAVTDCAEHVTAYTNSFAGMVKTITENYNTAEMNVEGLMNTLGDPNQIGLVKDILDKIG